MDKWDCFWAFLVGVILSFLAISLVNITSGVRDGSDAMKFIRGLKYESTVFAQGQLQEVQSGRYVRSITFLTVDKQYYPEKGETK